MRAVQIRTFGEPGIVLELADLPEPPAPAAGEVLIGVEHAPINMNDLKIPSALRETAPLVASGVIRVPIAATYRLTAFREAVAHVQRGGKVMFDVEGGI
jgi:NADPH:quinone reductase-like Zn-dependent oxidoreductase